MSTVLAVVDQGYAWLGMVPVLVISAGLIMNVASFQTKDLNRKSGHAANLLFLALIIEAATATVSAFGGASETGCFWAIVAAAVIHWMSAVIALLAIREHRLVGRWPHGRRRSAWGFWLNVVALLILAAWFWLGANPAVYKRIFG